MEYWEILIGIIISALTAGFGIYKYSEARKDEFKKVFWEKRYENYEHVIELASKIYVSNNLNTVTDEINEFRQYFWGKLAMIEDQGVYDAMINYNEELKKLEGSASDNFTVLEDTTYDLARACRNSLRATWEPVPLSDIKPKKTEKK